MLTDQDGPPSRSTHGHHWARFGDQVVTAAGNRVLPNRRNDSEWRRRRDSNPRKTFTFNGFQVRHHKPLGHSSVARKVADFPLKNQRVPWGPRWRSAPAPSSTTAPDAHAPHRAAWPIALDVAERGTGRCRVQHGWLTAPLPGGLMSADPRGFPAARGVGPIRERWGDMFARALATAAALSAVLMAGCATAPLSPAVIAPPRVPVAAVTEPAQPLLVTVPEITTCADSTDAGAAEIPGTPDATPLADTRCAREVMVSTAMSYLGKTSAEFDEVTATLVVREYDPDELLAEALADPSFRVLVAMSDVKPRDGRLSAAEAVEVETAVLKHLDAQL